jgi:uncharacterized protein YlxW (UPF0749 family)
MEEEISLHRQGAQLSIAFVCIILGIMLSLQYKTTIFHNASLFDQRGGKLEDMLDATMKEKDALEEKVDTLTQQLDNMRQQDEALKDLQAELNATYMSAGLVALEGPGLMITMNDRPSTLQANRNPNDDLIHEADLLMLINELKASGAEAISLNDERVTAMSEIRCAGPLIIVNQNRIGPPFVIKAIGDPELLEKGMSLGGGIYRQLVFQGFEMTMEQVLFLQMPANNQQSKFIYAKARGKDQ